MSIQQGTWHSIADSLLGLGKILVENTRKMNRVELSGKIFYIHIQIDKERQDKE